MFSPTLEHHLSDRMALRMLLPDLNTVVVMKIYDGGNSLFSHLRRLPQT